MSTSDAAILAALQGGAWVSGGELARAHGVSRAAVAKHVAALRRQGFAVAAAPRRGYRLEGAPDLLLPSLVAPLLATRRFGRALRHHERCGSTNDDAAAWARAGAPEGAVVVAEAQEQGRGRVGRSWHSPPGENLYLSLVLRPARPPHLVPPLTLAAGLAVFDACAARGLAPALKWPNDVLLGGRKASGILVELGAEAARVAFLVLGIGVNLNVDRASFPEEFRDQATSLSSHARRRIDRVAFARRLYHHLERTLDACAEGGFAVVRPRFEARFRMPGRRVRVLELDGSQIAGVALGIDDDGALRVRCDDGAEVRVVAGDVTLAKEGA